MPLRDTITVDPDAISSSNHQRVPLPAFVPRAVKITRDRMDAASRPAHVRVIGAAIEDPDRDYIARKLGMKLGRFAASVERVTVRLSDVNGPKGGVDQKCQVKVVLSGMPSVVVNETDSTWPRAVDRAIESAALAVRRRIQRRRLKPLHHRAQTSIQRGAAAVTRALPPSNR